MPSEWEWWVGVPGAEAYDLGLAMTRSEAVRIGLRETLPGDEFEIVEAQTSTARRYEGADFVPFIRSRNYERLKNGPHLSG